MFSTILCMYSIFSFILYLLIKPHQHPIHILKDQSEQELEATSFL